MNGKFLLIKNIENIFLFLVIQFQKIFKKLMDLNLIISDTSGKGYTHKYKVNEP